MNYEQLLAVLTAQSDTQYKQFNDKIVNSSVPSLGCRLPFLRNLAKNISLDDALAMPVNKYVELDMLRGMAIVKAKLPFDEKSVLLADYAETIENWASCDCNAVKVPRAEMQQYFDFFVKLLQSDKPFVCRYGVVCLMTNYLTDESVNKVFDALATVKTFGDYYVDMAVAWLVATAAAKCTQQTMSFLRGKGKQTLNVFAYNKALQKMRDSFRIDKQIKAETYVLKRID